MTLLVAIALLLSGIQGSAAAAGSAATAPDLAEQLRLAQWQDSDRPEDEAILSEDELPVDGQPVPPRFPAVRLGLASPLFAVRSGKLNLARAWNPHNGELRTLLALDQFEILRAIQTAQGTLFEVDAVGSNSPPASTSRHAVLVRPDGSALSVPLPLLRYDAKLVVLTDQSVLWVGGRVGHLGGESSPDVQWVRLQGEQLVVSILRPVPGPPRYRYSTVALDDGRLLLLGGSSDGAPPCRPPGCRSDSYFLDPKIDYWSSGPTLTQARADAAAVRLNDGRVLVAGGWTTDAEGHSAATASSEIWSGGSHFQATAPLVAPDVRPQLLNLPGSPIDTALLLNPDSGLVQGFDAQLGRWQLAAELPLLANQVVGPLASSRGAFLWASESSSTGRRWLKIPLRLPAVTSIAGAARYDPTQGVPFRRTRVGLLAGDDGHPTLIVGGSVSVREAERSDANKSSAVVALEDSGRIRNLPSLHIPRAGATVLRLADGSLIVAGGVGNDGQLVSAMEWLSSDNPPPGAVWQLVGDAPAASGWALDASDRLLAVDDRGQVQRLRLRFSADATLTLETERFPELPFPRPAEGGNVQTAPRVHGLADGRLLLTGGMVGRQRIAVLQLDSDAPSPSTDDDADCRLAMRTGWSEADEAMDQPESVGSLVEDCRPPAGLTWHADGSVSLAPLAYADLQEQDAPYGHDDRANDYAILDPDAGHWRSSARSQAFGGEMQVMRDGRVIRSVSLPPASDDPHGEYRQYYEISDVDGQSWQLLEADGQIPLLWSYGDEIFGFRDNDQGGRTLLWLNPEDLRWTELQRWSREEQRWTASFVLHRQRLSSGRSLWLPDRIPE